jgi:hypothetical protein
VVYDLRISAMDQFPDQAMDLKLISSTDVVDKVAIVVFGSARLSSLDPNEPPILVGEETPKGLL